MMYTSRPCAAQEHFETCATTTPDPTDSSAVASVLTPLPDARYQVEVHFTTNFPGETEAWTDREKAYICAAARHMSDVLSSQEFEKALLQLPDLVLNKDGFWHTRTDTIASVDLYKNLTRQNTIVMNLAVGDKRIECARSVVGDRGPTKFDKAYIDGSKTSCGGPLLAALTNTLGHEYTHYTSRFISYDNHVVNDRTYVSYGIGCLIQNIAFQGNTCWYDPRVSTPNSNR